MVEKTIKINEIVLTVKGQRLILTVEELKELKIEIDNLLDPSIYPFNTLFKNR